MKRRLGLSLACAALLVASVARGGDPNDPLADEIDRWSTYTKNNASTDETWMQIRDSSQQTLKRASDALRDGRRNLAIARLAAVRTNIAAFAWVEQRPPELRTDLVKFEAERKRMGGELRDAFGPASFDAIRPASLRAVAEAAHPQVKGFYDASLDAARETLPQYGLFYVGQAHAQRDFVALCRSLATTDTPRPPALRSLHGELEALESEMLAAYRPPASIDRHTEFIIAHSALKEARELDAAGLRFGALLLYLQAAQRYAPLRNERSSLDSDEITKKLEEFEARFAEPGVDHSIGRIFLESAQSDPANAPAIATDVLPRYVAALEPAKPEAARPEASVTVTLVRWPYT
jgi:hypothetical protein